MPPWSLLVLAPALVTNVYAHSSNNKSQLRDVDSGEHAGWYILSNPGLEPTENRSLGIDACVISFSTDFEIRHAWVAKGYKCEFFRDDQHCGNRLKTNQLGVQDRDDGKEYLFTPDLYPCVYTSRLVAIFASCMAPAWPHLAPQPRSFADGFDYPKAVTIQANRNLPTYGLFFDTNRKTFPMYFDNVCHNDNTTTNLEFILFQDPHTCNFYNDQGCLWSLTNAWEIESKQAGSWKAVRLSKGSNEWWYQCTQEKATSS
ncbi:hypothetical protein BDV96DRAFT_641668 [Lophiotrema nucula]|uniref:Uncharacterized protein n=1 Tax=Lophiotrema nucula TaxID=690887 RepID=A0A6A5ZS07_9PLEO|nr:hypothetical protein BDV96DRAFT_641668 [Lophiotrema nucula]